MKPGNDLYRGFVQPSFMGGSGSGSSNTHRTRGKKIKRVASVSVTNVRRSGRVAKMDADDCILDEKGGCVCPEGWKQMKLPGIVYVKPAEMPSSLQLHLPPGYDVGVTVTCCRRNFPNQSSRRKKKKFELHSSVYFTRFNVPGGEVGRTHWGRRLTSYIVDLFSNMDVAKRIYGEEPESVSVNFYNMKEYTVNAA